MTSTSPRKVGGGYICFSYVLGYSRRQYLWFSERQDFEATIRGHVAAFEHLQGVAATCLYDNMKVVVDRWEDERPVYNVRFLAFATHYGYRPWACRPRRPETKGKVERPFYYVQTNLLNGRTFRCLEHLNEVTRWWLANVADVREHRTTKKRPIDAHTEELPHLLPLPAQHFDTARVVYRVAGDDGTVAYANNSYSVPWRLVGELLPVRVTETELIVYNRHIQQVARHLLLQAVAGQTRIEPHHRPSNNHAEQLQQLRERFNQLGDVATRFLEGLLKKQRCGKRQAQRVLGLLGEYHQQDVVAAMHRAVQYHAYSLSSLERILAMQATPKESWQMLSESQQETLSSLSDSDSDQARPSEAYQYLLFDEEDTHGDETSDTQAERTEDSAADPGKYPNTEDPDNGTTT